MEDSLSNSFFYFFSSTSQVLAAILALFGFFVVFKIQTLKDELLRKAKELFEYVNSYIEEGDITSKRYVAGLLMQANIEHLNFKFFYNDIIKEVDEELNKHLPYKAFRQQYIEIYKLYRNLIKLTIGTSIFTAVTIIFCISIIPFSHYYICNPNELQRIFIIVIICNFLCFVGLISILIISFSSLKFKLSHDN